MRQPSRSPAALRGPSTSRAKRYAASSTARASSSPQASKGAFPSSSPNRNCSSSTKESSRRSALYQFSPAAIGRLQNQRDVAEACVRLILESIRNDAPRWRVGRAPRQAYFLAAFFASGAVRKAWDSRGLAFFTPETGAATAGSFRGAGAGGAGGKMLSRGAGTTSGGCPERWRFSSSSEWKSWICAPPRRTSSPFWFSAQRSSSAKYRPSSPQRSVTRPLQTTVSPGQTILENFTE